MATGRNARTYRPIPSLSTSQPRITLLLPAHQSNWSLNPALLRQFSSRTHPIAHPVQALTKANSLPSTPRHPSNSPLRYPPFTNFLRRTVPTYHLPRHSPSTTSLSSTTGPPSTRTASLTSPKAKLPTHHPSCYSPSRTPSYYTSSSPSPRSPSHASITLQPLFTHSPTRRTSPLPSPPSNPQ